MKSISYKKYVLATWKNQLWVFALSCLLFTLTLLPLLDFIWESGTYYELTDRQWQALSLLLPGTYQGGMRSYLFLAACLALGCLSGIAHFAFLHDPRQVDFIHSLPMKREKIFLARLLCAGLNFLPAVLASLLALAAMILNGLYFHRLLLAFGISLLTGFVFYLLSYLVSCLAMLLTGTLLVGVLGCAVFHLVCPLIQESLLIAKQHFFHNSWNLSPTPDWNLSDVSPLFAGFHTLKVLPSRQGFLALGLCALLVLLLAALCIWIYRKRPLEAAGQAMAFGWAGTLIQILLTAIAGFVLGIALSSMRLGEVSDFWLIIGFAAGSLLVYAAIQFLYTGVFKSLFAKAWALALALVLAGGVLLFYRADLSGFDSYLPEQEELEEVGLLVGYGNIFNTYSNGTLLQLQDVHIPCDSALYALLTHFPEKSLDTADWKSGNARYFPVNVRYHLKNGKDVYRLYHLPVETMAEEVAMLFDIPAFKDSLFAFCHLPEEYIQEITLFQGDYFLINQENKKAFLDTLAKDYQNLSSEIVRSEDPHTMINYWGPMAGEGASAIFRTGTPEVISVEDTWHYPSTYVPNAYGNVYVYSCFTNTLAFLEELGYEPTQGPEVEKVDEITIETYGEGYSLQNTTSIQDQEEKEALCPNLLWMDLCTIWSDVDLNRLVTVHLPGDKNTWETCRIRNGVIED